MVSADQRQTRPASAPREKRRRVLEAPRAVTYVWGGGRVETIRAEANVRKCGTEGLGGDRSAARGVRGFGARQGQPPT